MARKVDELKQYAEELAKEKGLTEPQIKIAVAFMTGDTEALKDVPLADVIAAVTPVADQAVGRRADHSRAMGEAQKAQKLAKQAYDDNQAWRGTAKADYDKALAERDAVLVNLKKYEDEFGPLDETVNIGGGKTVTATGDVVRTKDVEALRKTIKDETRAELAGQFMQFQFEEGQLATQHFARFKEPLNKARLIEIMGQHAVDNPKAAPLSLTQAYEVEYGEKVTKLDTDARAAEIRAAEDRGIEKGRKAAATAMGRSGAAVPETGIVFDRIEAERKAGDKKVIDAHSDDENAALFAQDLEQFSRSTTEADAT